MNLKINLHNASFLWLLTVCALLKEQSSRDLEVILVLILLYTK